MRRPMQEETSLRRLQQNDEQGAVDPAVAVPGVQLEEVGGEPEVEAHGAISKQVQGVRELHSQVRQEVRPMSKLWF